MHGNGLPEKIKSVNIVISHNDKSFNIMRFDRMQRLSLHRTIQISNTITLHKLV